MFSDKEGVLDRLTKSDHLQAIQCRLLSSHSRLLEKMTKLRSLRGIYLSDCRGNSEILTKIDSLRTLTLNSSRYALQDCSPFLKAFSAQDKRFPWLQEWCRGDGGFYLNKFHYEDPLIDRAVLQIPDARACDALVEEPRLGELKLHLSHSLPFVLPRCSSIHSLGVCWSFTLTEGTRVSLFDALSRTPFVYSLALFGIVELSSLSVSKLKSFQIRGTTVESIANALTGSKPKYLTHLDISEVEGSWDPLADALLECPALTNLLLGDGPADDDRDILPIVKVLHRLPPLTQITLDMTRFTDESIECLLSFLSRSPVRDLKLGSLSPEQLHLLADTLPSLSYLQSLEFGIYTFISAYESSQLALFSALTSSSIRSLVFRDAFFCSTEALDKCLNKLPASQLTNLYFDGLKAHSEGFDPSIHNHSYSSVDPKDLKIDWESRFPQIKDRFCIVTWWPRA
jgi:hypothetical protein